MIDGNSQWTLNELAPNIARDQEPTKDSNQARDPLTYLLQDDLCGSKLRREIDSDSLIHTPHLPNSVPRHKFFPFLVTSKYSLNYFLIFTIKGTIIKPINNSNKGKDELKLP